MTAAERCRGASFGDPEIGSPTTTTTTTTAIMLGRSCDKVFGLQGQVCRYVFQHFNRYVCTVCDRRSDVASWSRVSEGNS